LIKPTRSLFLSSRHCAHRDLPSFPTRRSSDLARNRPARHRKIAGAIARERAVARCRKRHPERKPRDPREVTIKVSRRDPSTALRSEEHTSELQSHLNLVCRLLLEKKNYTAKKL